MTCFAGDDDVPRDDESATLWRRLGIDQVRFLGRDDNWWGPAGAHRSVRTRHRDLLHARDDGGGSRSGTTCSWATRRRRTGAIAPLPRINVDTGMGLERTLVAINGLASVYEVDTVAPIHARDRRS